MFCALFLLFLGRFGERSEDRESKRKGVSSSFDMGKKTQRKEGKHFAQKHLMNSGNIPSGFENRTPWLESKGNG